MWRMSAPPWSRRVASVCRKTIYASLEALQADLDIFLVTLQHGSAAPRAVVLRDDADANVSGQCAARPGETAGGVTRTPGPARSVRSSTSFHRSWPCPVSQIPIPTPLAAQDPEQVSAQVISAYHAQRRVTRPPSNSMSTLLLASYRRPSAPITSRLCSYSYSR